MPRIKDLVIDGATYRLAALTMSQVEDFIKNRQEQLNAELVKDLITGVVVTGLNNALPKNASEEDKWTNARIREELDLVSYDKLFVEILNFSGLKWDTSKKAEGEPQPGESKAAS